MCIRDSLVDVAVDLGLVGVGARPGGVRCERVGVQVGRHVACGAGVGVIAPGAAEVGAAVEYHVVGEAVLGELDGGAEAGESCSDDGDLHVGRSAVSYTHLTLPTSDLV